MPAAHAESGYEEEFHVGCGDCGCVALVVAKVLFITFGGQEETVT